MNLEHIKQLHHDGLKRTNVLLVHGACMGAWVWQENLSPFFFNKGFHVHAISLRDHGASSKSSSMRNISVLDYANDLRNIINEIEGEIFVIGHSMGGFIIQHYLFDCSSKVRAVVMLCPVPRTGLWQFIPKLIWHYPYHFLLGTLNMSWLPIIKHEKRLKKLMFSESFPNDKMKAVTEAMQEESFLAFLEMAFLRLPKIKSLPVPVMIVAAEKDFLISLPSIRKMAAYFQVEPLIIKDAAHCFMFEPGWEKVAEKVADFFDGVVLRTT